MKISLQVTLSGSGRLLITLFFLISALALKAQTWQQNTGPYGEPVNHLVASGSNLIAGTGQGLLLSADDGISWTPVSGTLSSKPVYALISNGTNVFAGTYDGVFISSDNGATWVQKNNGLGVNTVTYSLTMQGNTLIKAGWGPSSIYRSADNGNTWTACANNGLTSGASFILGATNNVLIACSMSNIYRSTDYGDNWTDISSSATFFATDFISAVGNTLFLSTLFDGLYRSDDNGTSWVKINNIPTMPGSVNSVMSDGTSIFYGTTRGLYRSTTAVGSFSLLSSKIYPISLAVKGGRLYAGTGSGIYSSSDGGFTWSDLNSSPLLPRIDVVHKDADGLFACTPGALYSSQDNGSTWKRVQIGPNATELGCFAKNNSDVFISSQWGIFISTDAGVSWLFRFTGHVSSSTIANAIVIKDNKTYIADGSEILISVKNNGNWSAFQTLPQLPQFSFPSCMAVKGDSVLVGTYNGLFLSVNHGNWLNISSGLSFSPIDSLVKFVGFRGNEMYATTNRGIFVSSGNGATWTALNNGLSNLEVNTLYFTGNEMYAGTNDGVFRSPDNGASWSAFGNNLPPQTSVITIISDGSALMAGTSEAGLWKASVINGIVKWKPVSSSHIYPNPVEAGRSVYLGSSEKLEGPVRIFDARGNEVYNKSHKVEQGSVEIPLNGLTPGIYMVRLPGTNAEVKKLIVK
jgi:photosystem II stability/assembly factor-like uncharacterized protein